jgi:hypothetical protein
MEDQEKIELGKRIDSMISAQLESMKTLGQIQGGVSGLRDRVRSMSITVENNSRDIAAQARELAKHQVQCGTITSVDLIKTQLASLSGERLERAKWHSGLNKYIIVIVAAVLAFLAGRLELRSSSALPNGQGQVPAHK